MVIQATNEVGKDETQELNLASTIYRQQAVFYYIRGRKLFTLTKEKLSEKSSFKDAPIII